MNKDLVYFSQTGNCERFANKMQDYFENIYKLKEYNKDSKFVLIMPTYGFGEPPRQVIKFLNKYGKNCLGIIGSGHKNWGKNFAIGSEILSNHFNIKLLFKIEQAGSDEDIKLFKEILNKNEI